MRMRVGMIGLAWLCCACLAQAQVTLPTPTNPMTVCIRQPLPPAESYQLVFDAGAPEAVTVTTPADPAKCATTDTSSFTVPASRWTAGQHTLSVIATNPGGSTTGTAFTVTIETPKPGEPVITAVVAGAVVTPPVGQALATYGLTAGSATFGLALPQGAATSGLRLGALTTQADVKTRWADGSIRFAVVSASVPSAGQYAVTAGAATSGAVTPTWPAASVTFTISGTQWVAALPAYNNGMESWLVGPVVREARVMVEPRNGSTDHPLLQVIYDVRSYASGGHRIDVTVQNTKDIPAADAVRYDVVIHVAGQAVFSRTGITHYIFQRWRKTFTTGLQLATVTPDFEPFHRAKALPRFLPTVQNKVYDTSTADYDILKFGTMSPYMMTPGGRAEIGPYPFWVAQYIVHKQPSQLEVLLRHGEYAGSWPMSVTEADGTSIISLDNYPNYWLDGRGGQGHPNGPAVPRAQDGSLRGYPPDPVRPDNQHLPALCYVPYLVTGDRFFVDQLKLVAAWGMIFTYPGDSRQNGIDFGRQAGKGLLIQNGGRGMAWPMRELIDAAAYLPDTDPAKPYFVARVKTNLEWLDTYARTSIASPIGAVFWERNTGIEDPPFYAISIWQLGYLAWATDHAGQQGFGPVQAFRDRCVQLQVRFFTSAAQGYPPQFGAPYYPRVGRLVNGVLQHFANMGEVFTYNHGDLSGYPANDPQPGHRLPQPIIGYYGPEARLLLLMGVRENIPGAKQAWDWLMAYRDGTASVLGDVNARSGFAIAESDTGG